MTALLQVEQLAVEIDGVEVVSRVDLQIDRGQCLGVVGETGSGKSMTCSAVTGTLARIGARITRGSVLFDGIDLAGLGRSGWRQVRGRRIALIPQSSMHSLNPIMRVGGHLAETIRNLEGRGTRESTRRRALELLELVHLDDAERVLHSYPHQLSGGMRQRVMIALAVAGHPDLLIADEPTTALDVTVQRGILDLLSQLCETTGTGLLFVTHDLGIVESITDRVAVLYAGTTVESGPTVDVLADPLHPYTRALLGARPSALAPGDRLEGIAGSPPSPTERPPGCRFQPRCPAAIAACLDGLPDLRQLGAGRSSACLRSTELVA